MRVVNEDPAVDLTAVTDDLAARLRTLTFSEPVTHIYNPLEYARTGYDRYVRRFGIGPKQFLLLGMNPGPFGMAQTGVPFGDVVMVREWMGIEATVSQPKSPHPKRPVDGFACRRREVSGRRLWEWARQRFGSPDAFFERFFVINYCPLVFMEASGRNRTPDRLPVAEKNAVFQVCDQALRRTVSAYKPRWVIGIGGFAQQRAQAALVGLDVKIGRIIHPSPANPQANRGWAQIVETELAKMGIEVDAKQA